MDDLIAFVKARLDEGEASTQALLRTAQRAVATSIDPGLIGRRIPGWHSWPDVEAMCTSRLRDIEAKRALLAWYADSVDASELFREKLGTGTHMATAAESYLNVIKGIAAAWSDHPDYKSGWALQPS